MKKFRLLIRRMPGLALFSILLIIRLIFAAFPWVFEAVYFNTVFPFLRSIQSLIYPVWIIPGYLVLVILVLGLVVLYFIRRKSFRHFLIRLLNLSFWLMSIFLLTFGFQYADPGIAERLELSNVPQTTDLSKLYYETMEDALEKRSRIEGLNDSDNITQIDYTIPYDTIHVYVRNILQPAGYKAAAVDQRVREFPYFILRRLSISGIYNPFTGESNVEAKLPYLMKCFVAAHELAHASGITGEGEANFVAWLSLAHSGDPYLEYSAAYFIWRQVAKPLNKKLDPKDLEILASQIPEELMLDRKAIYEALHQEKPIYPELSSRINDSYLKIQGIDSGVDDYDRFLELYLRYQRSI